MFVIVFEVVGCGFAIKCMTCGWALAMLLGFTTDFY